MHQIVECVPNFSDGRRPEVYEAIAGAVRSVPGVSLLSVSPDPDHNRTVITFVGGPKEVEEAAYRAIAQAARLINMDEHKGEHPRLGATDVCPFVPVRGVNMAECVALAESLGRRVGQELGIAVYLYAEAARRPDRVLLADIRKGEYERWKEEIGHNPERAPDFGPAEPRPWGATVIGARPFLIAYNLYLNSDDVAVANKIARAVRYSSGGLRYVQALGFLVEGQAQVSMNLTNFQKTPVARVQEMVKQEAARYGLQVTRGELVGLIPQQALVDAARWYLQLHSMQDDQILENKLAPVAAEEAAGIVPAPDAFLEATAAGTPTPGGGSVAALAGALGAALTEMMAGLTVGRKKYAGVSAEAQQLGQEAAALRASLTQAIAEDAAVFNGLMAVYRNRELAGEARSAAIEKATVAAAEVPLRVARASRDVARLAARIVAVGNSNAVTDGASAGIMARAAVQAAAMNVKINLTGVQDRELAHSWGEEVVALEQETTALAAEMMATAARRGGFA